MSEMVERVARVICQCAGYKPDEPVAMLSKPNGKGTRWEFYISEARYVIEAMREPTEEMLSAGPGSPYMDRDVWAKMINEALK